MSHRMCLAPLTILCWIMVSTAHAGVSLSDGDTKGVGSINPLRYTVVYQSRTFLGGNDPAIEDLVETSGPDLNDATQITVSNSFEGDTGTFTTSYEAIFNLNSSNNLSGSFEALTSGSLVDSATPNTPTVSGSAFLSISFLVETAPIEITIEGNMSGSGQPRSVPPVGSNGNPEVLLTGQSGDIVHISPNPFEPINRPIDESHNLAPGAYTLELICSAAATNVDCSGGKGLNCDRSGSNASAVATLNVQIEIGTGQESGEEVFWSTNNGNYNEPSNWEPQQVPSATQTAVFDRDADYTVTMGTEEETGRAIVERGEVVFSGGHYRLSGGTEETGSLVVGSSAQDVATLDLQLDFLTTNHTVVGDSGPSAAVFSDESCVWNNQGRLSVGGQNIGGVTIENRALLTTAELRIGDGPFSFGELAVRNSTLLEPEFNKSLEAGSTAVWLGFVGILRVESSAIETGATEIGSLAGSIGAASVTGTPATNVGWVAESLIVGKSGNGSLSITDGNAVRVEGDIAMGLQESASAVVRLKGTAENDNPSVLLFDSSSNGTMTVGGSGYAELHIEAGGLCGTPNAVIGASPTGNVGGFVTVNGKSVNGEPSRLIVTGETLQIGRIGTTTDQLTGILSIEEGAEVECINAFVGHEGGRGVLFVEADSKFTASGEFFSSRSDATVDPPQPLTTTRIINHGLIDANSIVLDVGTEVEGNGIFAATDTIDYAGVTEPVPVDGESKGPTQFGVITFDGDFNMERGEFILDVGGTDESQTDRIAIIGNANITGGTINFNFVNGFLPQTGEMIPFLDVSGNTTFENVQATYTGAADGFEFNLIEQEGMLMLEALNNAQPVGGEPTPRPTALNPDADVNGDNIINASDLLEVMNNWYRVISP